MLRHRRHGQTNILKTPDMPLFHLTTTRCLVSLLAMAVAGWIVGQELARRSAPLPEPVPTQAVSLRPPATTESQSISLETRWQHMLATPDPQALVKTFAELSLALLKEDPEGGWQLLIRDYELLERTEVNPLLPGQVMLLVTALLQREKWSPQTVQASMDQLPARLRPLLQSAYGIGLAARSKSPEDLAKALADLPAENLAAWKGATQSYLERNTEAGITILEGILAQYAQKGAATQQAEELKASGVAVLLARNPEKAADFLMKAPCEPDAKIRRLLTIVNLWAPLAPNACGEWLNRQPRTADEDSALAAFVRHVHGHDIESARAWAAQIKDDQIRESLLESLKP